MSELRSTGPQFWKSLILVLKFRLFTTNLNLCLIILFITVSRVLERIIVSAEAFIFEWSVCYQQEVIF